MTSGAAQTQPQIDHDTYRDMPAREAEVEPIIAAVDGSSASDVAVETAVNFASELDAPIVSV